MEAFIRTDQYFYIKKQAQNLINGHSSVNDSGVLSALKSLANERALELFEELHAEQKSILNQIIDVKTNDDMEKYLLSLKPYVIPFQEVTESTMKKLFPKMKKVKAPDFGEMDSKETTYLSWIDKGSNKKLLIVPYHNNLIGLSGSFTSINQKGICVICNGLEDVGLFVSEEKGLGQGKFVKRGNYVCKDNQACNQNLTSLDRLTDFISRLKK
jgi:hypothetical protein